MTSTASDWASIRLFFGYLSLEVFGHSFPQNSLNSRRHCHFGWPSSESQDLLLVGGVRCFNLGVATSSSCRDRVKWWVPRPPPCRLMRRLTECPTTAPCKMVHHALSQRQSQNHQRCLSTRAITENAHVQLSRIQRQTASFPPFYPACS